MAVLSVSSFSRHYTHGNGYLLPGIPFTPPSAGLTEPIYVEILNSNLVSQGVVQFVSISAQLYFNAVGSYSILVPYTDSLWAMLMAGDFIVSVNWGGLFTFGGKCEQPQYSDSIPGSYGGQGQFAGPFITLNGGDYLALIANRIAYPNPTVAWASQTAGSTDAQTAQPLETAIKYYVNRNAGPGALAARRHSLLDIGPNLGRGSNVSYTVKFGSGVDLNLLDVIRALTAQSGASMGVSIVRVPATHRLTFDVYVPRDLSGKAWFSETLGNLTAISLSLTDPTVTDALVQGSGTSFVSRVATNRTQWNLTENFIDDSSETDANNLATAAQQAIASGAAGPTLSATATDIPFLTYGRDYRLGDIVTVEVRPGNTYSDVVSGVTLTADPSQTPEIIVVPTIGQSSNATATDPSVIGQLTARIKAVEKKLSTK